jgi:hypothetical protein
LASPDLGQNEGGNRAIKQKNRIDNNVVEQVVLQSVKRLLSVVAVLAGTFLSHGLTIVSGPSINPATNAPLAAILQLTTDVDSRVSVSVNDGSSVWVRNFYDYGMSHSLPLLGFKTGRTNQITVTVRDKSRNELTGSQALSFVTGPLPGDFPQITVKVSAPESMEPGYTLFKAANGNPTGYVIIVDSSGEVVWYAPLPTSIDVRQLQDGNLFIPTRDTNGFSEINMLGDTVTTWLAPEGLPVDPHDGVPTDHGTILYLNDTNRTITNFPSSAIDPSAPLMTTNVSCNIVVEMSATNSALLGSWSLIDMLDPTRIDYLTFQFPSFGVDAEHANAVIEDPKDDSLIVSLRNQDAVVKFSRATGQIKWILGPHENWGPAWQPYLLTPVGTPFEWHYGQHAPQLTPQGTLLLYDNGNLRAEPFEQQVDNADNYSRGVEYSIDEDQMEVTQVWDYGRTNADRLYTDRLGCADWLPQRQNVLITFGWVLYENGSPSSPYSSGASMVRIKEVTHDPNPKVVFDLQLFDPGNTNSTYQGCSVYRSHRIPDLYAHPTNPVVDLMMSFTNGTPVLQFSADETKIYTIQSSQDLLNWSQIGVATPDQQMAGFYFEDTQTNLAPARFYRVLTQ